jgi:hypothetical protein
MLHEGIEVKAPMRTLLPSYEGVKKQDNADLYWSLKRSYINMGSAERPPIGEDG